MTLIKNLALLSLFAFTSADALAARSPYLPSQGDLKASANCSGLSIRPGDRVQVKANARGVTIETASQTVLLGASNYPLDSSVATIGSFGGLVPGFTMPLPEPILINGQLIYNTFGPIGGGGGMQVMPAGMLVEPDFSFANPKITDTGHSILLEGTKIDTRSNASTDVEDIKCELE